MVEFNIPIQTVSEANRASHEHWRVRAKRAKEQRMLTSMIARAPIFANLYGKHPPYVITLTRLAPRKLDTDNLVGSSKHVQDGLADALGLDDRNPLVTWLYAQEKSKTYGVRVQIATTIDGLICPTCKRSYTGPPMLTSSLFYEKDRKP